jgi:ferredoxin
MSLKIHPAYCPQNHRCPLLHVCPVGAISQDGIGLPVINDALCIQCGKCTRYCALGAVVKVD